MSAEVQNMTEIITATFQDGAFVPEGQTHFPAGSRVRLVVQSLDPQQEIEQALQEFDSLCDEINITSGDHLTREQLHDRY